MKPCAYLGKVCKYKLILYLTSLFAFIGSEFGLERQGDRSQDRRLRAGGVDLAVARRVQELRRALPGGRLLRHVVPTIIT